MRPLLSWIAAAALTCAALPVRAEEPAPEPADGGATWQEITGWTAVGLGGAALITGVVFAGLASSADSEHEEGVALLQTYEDLDALNSKGTTYNKVMVGGIVAGLVAAVIGAHLLVWGKAEREARRDRASALLAPMLTEGGAGLAAVGRF